MKASLRLATALLGTLLASGGWLLASTSGLRATASLAGTLSGGQLQVDVAGGRLLGPLDLAAVRWETPTRRIVADNLHLDWSPGTLLDGRLHIARLDIARLQIDGPGDPAPGPAPDALTLPFAVDLDTASISRLEIHDTLIAEAIAARFHSDGRQHRLSALQARSHEIALHGEATLEGEAPLTLQAQLQADGQLAGQALTLNLKASGPLARLGLDLAASGSLRGQARATLTPFAPAPFAEATIALQGIDPATWHAGAPQATLDVNADIAPQDDTIAGRFRVENRQPGPVDRQRLPIAYLAGSLRWTAAGTRFDQLQVRLPGQGELTGQGKLAQGDLHLDLQARRLDAASLVSRLRSTAFDGTIAAQLGATAQTLKLDLQDRQFRLLADASKTAAQLTLARLELAAGEARLSASGDLSLDGERPFKLHGELQKFDPSRFARLPAASLNAHLDAHGKLAPAARMDAEFKLHDSHLAGQPFAGDGRMTLNWPRVPSLDLRLQAGPNRLAASGAFGRPEDRLTLVIDAPELGPYGLEGDLAGQLRLAGNLRTPAIEAQLHSKRLGLPGRGRVHGLVLNADIGSDATARLDLGLAIDRFDTPVQPGLLTALQLTLTGTRASHRLQASAGIVESRLQLAAEGGLRPGEPWGWQGRLNELRLSDKTSARNVRLGAPGDLSVGASGWTVGPLRLQGDPLDWQATLQARSDGKHLQASLQGRGSRIGKLDGTLDAAMLDPWSLNQHAPWQGRLQADVTDLAWLAELIGDGWQSEGRLQGELSLAGTPALPLASGRFNGDQLALRLPEQGLNLARGELAVDLERNLLRVRRLGFDSLLQPLPRPLKLGTRDDLAALTQRPGRLDIAGEMRVDRHAGADQAFLDVRLDRVGAWQLADQWLALSGNTRLSLRDGTLGIQGKLAVDAGYWQLAPGGTPRLSEDVVIKRPGQATTPSLRPKLDLDVTTDFGSHFLFNGAGLASRLAGEVRLRATGRDLPRASGSIRTRDGRFEAYGQKLEIERGILSFQGLPDNPALDVRAVRKGLAVEPGVQIGGTAQRPVIKLISDPELPDAEKLSWLVLGHGPEQMSTGDASVLLSAAGGLLGNDSGNLVQQLKKAFGLDDFGVRQGNLGDTGSRRQASRIAASSSDTTATTGNQIFSVGKRLSSNAMLSYEQSLGKAESIVKLTVNLTRQIAVIGRAGSDNALDLFYTLSFGRDKPAASKDKAK